MLYIEIIYNLSLLVALSVFTGFIWHKENWSFLTKSILQGLIFGSIAVVGMLYPLQFAEGVIFDGRSVVISLCGLFFGPVSVVIAGALSMAFRIYQGGVGVLTGSFVIIASAIIGVLFHYRYFRKSNRIKMIQLVSMGFIVHLAMFLLMFTFPYHIAVNVLNKMSIAILTVYPLATIIIGKIISDNLEKSSYTATLKASEERYRSFIFQVSEGVFRFELEKPMPVDLPLEEQVDFIYQNARIAECNNAFLKMYGLKSIEQIIGKKQIELHGNSNNPINREVMRNFIRNNYVVENLLTEEVNINGQKVFFTNNSIGIVENGKLVRMWGTQIDVSQKIKADQIQNVLYEISKATISSESLFGLLEIVRLQLGKLLDSTNFYIAFYDKKTGMLSTEYDVDQKDSISSWPAEKSATGYVIKNKKSLLATDIDFQELVNNGEIELIGTMSKVWLGVPLIVKKEAIGAIVVQNYEDRNSYNEKDKLMLEFISGQIGISIERKKAEEELKDALIKAQESDRLKSAFLANMSHEIRTPMNGILGFTNLLAETNITAEEKREFISIIQKSSERMLNTVNDLIDISKIETGQMQTVYSKINVNQQLQTLIEFFVLQAKEKNLTLKFNNKITNYDTVISTDVTKFDSILTNLIKNAIKYTDSGTIEVGCSNEGNYLLFYVRDTGIGIPKHRQEAVFKRFEQADINDSRAMQGSGLGLAIAKAYVEMLGGKIWLESQEGKETVFSFTLPNYTVEQTPQTDYKADLSVPHKINNRKLKILIAEDDEVGFIYLKTILKPFHSEIIHCKNGNEAVDFCRRNPDLNLILMDMRMPGLNGFEATREIRNFNKNVRIVAQTAFALAGNKEKAIEAGCNDFIPKPINRNDIISIVEELF
jgi:signal transduction histidine kinase/PAS domain-containing protein